MVYFWIKDHKEEPLDKDYSRTQFELLPRYIQKQLTHEEFYKVAAKCRTQLLKIQEA